MSNISQIEENLYLSSLGARQNKLLLKELGIEVVVAALTVSERETFDGSIEGIDDYDITLDDTPQADLLTALRKLIVILEKEKGKKVLVHCVAGVSRSPSLVIGYLIYRDGLSYEEAYKKVKEARPFIYPNVGFVKQLMQSFLSSMS